MAYFDMDMNQKLEFYGVLADIIKIRYDKYSQTLFKGMWYGNSASQTHRSTNVVKDECGMMRVKSTHMPSQDKSSFQPFITPKNNIQVYYVNNRINLGWLLVLEAQARSKPIVYRTDEILISPVGDSESRVEESQLLVEVNETKDYERDKEELMSSGDESEHVLPTVSRVTRLRIL